MMDWLISLAMSLIAPKLDDQVVEIITDSVGSLVEFVLALVQDPERTPEEVINLVEELLDDALDAVPGWGELSESERDQALGGLSIIALLIADVAQPPRKKKRRKKKRDRTSKAVSKLTGINPDLVAHLAVKPVGQ